MNKIREQLCPAWLSLLLGAVVIAALVAAYPRADVHTRSLSTQQASMISVAYLEAWLLVEPDSPAYLESLAMQYLELGRWQSALGASRRFSQAAQDDTGKRKALFLELVATEQMAYALPEDAPERELGVNRVAAILGEAAGLSWNIAAMRSLAEKARTAGADDAMVRFYQKLAQTDTENSARWQARLGEVALATQAYETAAFSFFSAYETAVLFDEKRHYFIRALQVLESAGKVEQACAEAQQRLGVLASDSQTLRYLLTLARQANRGDLAAVYARSLLKAVGGPRQQARGRDASIVLVAAHASALSHDAGTDMAALEEEYKLVYQTFIESGALDDAEQVARMALDAGLDRLAWSANLARAAQWNQHPGVALEHWLWYAQASNDQEAWRQVLALAPAQDDDDAYLLAWMRQHAETSEGASGTQAGLNALAAEYMRAGRWTSMLRVIERLKPLGDGQARQRVMMLEIMALEQHAYEFEPGDPRREALMHRLHATMEGSLPLPLDPSSMEWLAQKAEATGADAVAERYYSRLAAEDSGNAAHWLGKRGDFALGRQAYEDAAEAYFSAREAAQDRDEQRRYFQAGLGAFVAGGKVGQACEAGERRAGDLMDDPATLRYLIDLARQAHRTDLMTRYARALIQTRQEDRAGSSRIGLVWSDMGGASMQAGFWRGGLPVRHADFRPSDAAGRFMAENAAGMSENQEGDVDDLDIAFQAFVESRQLSDAERTAQRALDEGRDPQVWGPRLAQVAEWNGNPRTALRHWLQYAQASGNEQAWANVLVLSMQLNDNAAQLAALKHMSARAPGDLELLDQVVHAYELLGQPEAGLAYLKSRAQGSLRTPMLERYADLAERSGNDEAARQAYEALGGSGANAWQYAMRLASMDYAQGDLAGALARLRDARDQAGRGPETVPYWRLYSELARLARSREDAGFAHEGLLETGQANDADLNALAYLYELSPIDGGRLAEAQFRKDGSPAALQSALRMYASVRAWGRIEQLLRALPPEQRGFFAHSGQLLSARADYYIGTQRWEAALADLRAAANMPDADDYVRVAYLWTLTWFGTEAELRKAVHRWRKAAQTHASYWDVLAAAQMRLGNPVSAAHYLRRQRLSSGDDPLWLMMLADAEEASGHVERAWRIRRQAWKLLREKAPLGQDLEASGAAEGGAWDLFGPTPQDARHRNAARIALSQQLANGDYSRALLVKLLRQEIRSPEQAELTRSLLGDKASLPALDEVVPSTADGGRNRREPIGPVLRDAVLAWALGGEHDSLARAWLTRRYADRLLSPVDAEVTLALMEGDPVELGILLDDRRKNIPVESRVDALAAVGRIPEAQMLAFDAMDGAPESDARYQAMADLLMRDRPAMGMDVEHVDNDSLKYLQTSVTGGLKLTNRWGIGMEAIDRRQKTTDQDVLAWVPSHDRELNLTLSDTTPERKLSMTVGVRNASETFHTVSLRADLNRQGAFKTSFLLGLNQFTDASQLLQAGGAKDLAQVSWQWDSGARWFLWGSAQANRLLDQDRTYIGRGLEVSGDLGYRFLLSHPDWSVRLTAAHGTYSASGNTIHRMRRLLPSGHSLSASEIVPEDFTQYGVIVGFGSSDQNAYWRRWRLFLDAGYVHDSKEGWGALVNFGAGGSVFGGDHLHVFYSHTAARQGDGSSMSRIGLSYRLFF
ncbi:tetratricopeptide repeat protein [Paracandidimonas soli]|uniref:Tetratricopeptide repeat protein n=1 Tax=Paracandidimonas soli TaxID=1917182 RepID=A0A4R3V8P9_9BURK|nr:tetratricopeptide repeat protein [Paracandidimonas soli]TCV01557.1 tetratricopeptide repeat protein [Paracandidimonas soli]